MIQTDTNPLAGNQGADKTSGGRTLSLTNAALELAANGWPVFPCRWCGESAKAPLTINGHLDATTDRDVIKAWWLRWPDAMIGAVVPESLLVIDIDPRNGGDLEQLVNLVGDLPPTLTVWSGRNDGGQHLAPQLLELVETGGEPFSPNDRAVVGSRKFHHYSHMPADLLDRA